MEDLFTITCGFCGRTHPVADWKRTMAGDLPADQFQCPSCKRAFARKRNPNHHQKPWEKLIQLIPVQPSL